MEDYDTNEKVAETLAEIAALHGPGHPSELNVLYLQGKAAERGHNLELARHFYTLAIDLFQHQDHSSPAHIESAGHALTALARVSLARKESAGVAGLLERAIALFETGFDKRSPLLWEPLYLLGECEELAGNLAHAALHYERAANLTFGPEAPEDAQVVTLRRLAGVRFALKDYKKVLLYIEEARAAYEELKSQDPALGASLQLLHGAAVLALELRLWPLLRPELLSIFSKLKTLK